MQVSQVASISCVHDLFLFKKWMHSEFVNQFFGMVIRQNTVLFLYKTTLNEMGAASILPVEETHVGYHHKKEHKFPITVFLSKGTSFGISKVADRGEVMKDCEDASYKQCLRVVT